MENTTKGTPALFWQREHVGAFQKMFSIKDTQRGNLRIWTFNQRNTKRYPKMEAFLLRVHKYEFPKALFPLRITTAGSQSELFTGETQRVILKPYFDSGTRRRNQKMTKDSRRGTQDFYNGITTANCNILHSYQGDSRNFANGKPLKSQNPHLQE